MKTILLALTLFSTGSLFASGHQSYLCYGLSGQKVHSYNYIRMVYFSGVDGNNYTHAILHKQDQRDYNINKVGKITEVERYKPCRIINDGDYDRCRNTPSTKVNVNKYSDFSGDGELDFVAFSGFHGEVKFLGDPKVYRASFKVCPAARTVRRDL